MTIEPSNPPRQPKPSDPPDRKPDTDPHPMPPTNPRARWIGAFLATVVVLVTASSCDPGTVIENTPTEDSRGNKTCTIVVRPDDLDSGPFRLEDQRESRCKRCPKGARWPDCNKEKRSDASAREE